MDKDAFRAADGEMVIRADMTLGGAKISVSLGDDTNLATPGNETDYISLGVTGTAGALTMHWPLKTQTPLGWTMTTTQQRHSNPKPV